MLYPELRLRFVDEVPPAPMLASGAETRDVPEGQASCLMGKDRWVAVEGDEIVLFAAGDGAGPAREIERQATYGGRLVATLGNVVVLAGEDAPWAFFRCQDDHLIPVGEVGRDTLMVSGHILRNGQIYLIGRGAGTDEQIAIPELEHPPVVPGVGRYDHLEAWRTIVGVPHSAGGWRSYRSFQEVLAEALADAGIAALADPGNRPATLVLWFRDTCAGLSVLVVPNATSSVLDLDGLHLADNDGTSHVQTALKPFWQFAVGFADEEQQRPVEIGDRIENVVCVRTP